MSEPSEAADPTSPARPERRSPPPEHVPRTAAHGEDVYILTFNTSEQLHKDMTALRNKYFPPKLNRLEAHLTLFHALPQSKLEDSIQPVLEQTAASQNGFDISAATPFKLRRGIAIGVPKGSGGDTARAIHASLQSQWRDFLSDQDAAGFAAHYTIMNKVDREEDVNKAFAEVKKDWQPCHGSVKGLSLWRYNQSRWEWTRDYTFVASK